MHQSRIPYLWGVIRCGVTSCVLDESVLGGSLLLNLP